MPGYPPFGTHPIKCGNAKCSFRGYETDLKKEPSSIGGVASVQSVCPLCGNKSYQFMPDKQAKREKCHECGRFVSKKELAKVPKNGVPWCSDCVSNCD